MIDQPLLAESYAQYLVRAYEHIAHPYLFDQPIAKEGFNISLRHDLVELHVIQEGDKNMVWGNVQLAIGKLKEWYNAKETGNQVPWLEVGVQNGWFLEGWVRMVEKNPKWRGCVSVARE